MKKSRYLLVLLLAANSCFSQQKHPQNKQEIVVVCDKFMEAFRNEKYSQAFNSLKPYSVIENYKIDTIANTAAHQMRDVGRAYGKMVGVDFVAERPVKSSVIKLVYMLKFEKSFLEFHFIIYNNGSGWTITNFKYDEDMTDLY